MKRLLLCAVVLLLAVNAAFCYSGGTGLAGSPYEISSKADLMQLAATPGDYGSYFVMTQNIDMEGELFTASIIPAGSGFTGSFDGGGFEIYNFSINSSDTYYTGVFGRVNGGTISNLGVNSSPAGVSGKSYTGGLVGFNSGTITDCYFTGGVAGTGETGGLAGYNSGTITRCSYEGAVTCSGYRLGGLVGYNPNGSISDCYSSGSVTQTGTGHYTGGLVGRATGPLCSITNCHSNSQVNGFVSVGGLIGELDNVGTFRRCYAAGDVYATNNTVGGLLGRLRTNTIQHCYATGQVSSDSGNVGGLIGYNTGIVESCYSTGSVSGTSEVGGIAGDNAGTITKCVATGDITGDDDGYIGGLVGENNYFIERSFALGSASGGYQGVGGLVGINRHTISLCFAAGSARSDDGDPGTSYHERYVGGLVGANTWKIENCYSTGNAYGNNMVGGLIGQNESNDDVINCYSTGNPSGVDHVGGSVGYWKNGDVLDCYWDTVTSGQGNAMGYINPSGAGTTTITGMNTADMMIQGNYTSWDFAGTTLDGTDDIWFMPAGDYPKLFFCYDLDGDGELTAEDIFEMFAQWLGPGVADITGPAGVPDGIVNMLDFAELLEQVGAW